jgi:hypothetical protein
LQRNLDAIMLLDKSNNNVVDDIKGPKKDCGI